MSLCQFYKNHADPLDKEWRAFGVQHFYGETESILLVFLQCHIELDSNMKIWQAIV